MHVRNGVGWCCVKSVPLARIEYILQIHRTQTCLFHNLCGVVAFADMVIAVGADTYVVGRAQGSAVTVYPDKEVFPKWRHMFKRLKNETDGGMQQRVLEALLKLRKQRQAHAPPLQLKHSLANIIPINLVDYLNVS